MKRSAAGGAVGWALLCWGVTVASDAGRVIGEAAAPAAESARILRAFAKAVSLADRLDGEADSGRISPRLIPGTWAALKLALITLGSPLLGPWVGIRAARNHRAVKVIIERFPEVIDEILAGRQPDYPLARVARVDAGRRWFVVSDLHRFVPGFLDWPTRQGSVEVYEAALDVYASRGWGLIENGDIEEYWLVGGSAYGVVYDLGRMVAAAIGGAAGRRLRSAVYGEHFRRIVQNNRPTFTRVREGFHDRGRFVRVVGNHDDIYEDDSLAQLLQHELPGLRPVDFVVMEDPSGDPVGLVMHGHQVDGWCGPAIPNRIARFTSSLGSAICDLPLTSSEPGLPRPEDTRALLDGRARNCLTRVNGLTGATSGFESLDEVRLFEAARRWWGRDGSDLTGGPIVVAGHTHIPLSSPSSPQGGSWSRYLNSGSGITCELVTGVEWDGSGDAADPSVRLVGWAYDERSGTSGAVRAPGADAALASDRQVVRYVLERAGPDGRLAASRGEL